MGAVRVVLVLVLCVHAATVAALAAQRRVVVAGATGYVGRAVVKELVRRGVPTTALVRSPESELPRLTREYLVGSDVQTCDVSDASALKQLFAQLEPAAVVCCLASRSGIKKDAYAVDYGCGANLLHALPDGGHYTLLSAYCVQKPLLQLQQAKLKLEAEIRAAAPRVTHSIARPTAYTKSLDGQIEQARKGNSILYFGAGTCAANAIDEGELAAFMADATLSPAAIGMLDATRNVGGPDVPPVSKLEQIDLIYDALGVERGSPDRRKMSIPVGVFDVLLGVSTGLGGLARGLGPALAGLAEKLEDGAEIVRIVRYYATEPMVATGPGEVQGSLGIASHFKRVAERGGRLLETDEYTTTAGVLKLVASNKYDGGKQGGSQ